MTNRYKQIQMDRINKSDHFETIKTIIKEQFKCDQTDQATIVS